MKFSQFMKTFLQEAPESIRGYLNLRELYRIVLLSIAAGGGAEVIMNNLHNALGSVIVNPNDLAWVSAVFVAIVEIYRRFQHGSLPAVETSNPQVSNCPQ